MSENGPADSEAQETTTIESPEVVPADEAKEAAANPIEEPAKIMRIGSMIKQLLEELRDTEMDDNARERLRKIYETSIDELGSSLSPELCDELNRLTSDFDEGETPTDAELRMAKAQLVGWLEGLFQGIQATLIAQQMAARQQLENMRGQLGGGPGPGGPPVPPMGGVPAGQEPPTDRPGTYL